MDQLSVADFVAITIAANLATFAILGLYAYSLISMHRRGVSAQNVLFFGVASLFTLSAAYSLHQLLAG